MICPNCRKRSLSVARNYPSMTSSSTRAYSYLGQGRWAEMELNLCPRCGYSQWVKLRAVDTGFAGDNIMFDHSIMEAAKLDKMKGEKDDIR